MSGRPTGGCQAPGQVRVHGRAGLRNGSPKIPAPGQALSRLRFSLCMCPYPLGAPFLELGCAHIPERAASRQARRVPPEKPERTQKLS